MKAILLVRVSTKAQDFDEQEREIYNMAIKDGYLPECIIPVCEKESGIKLAEEERAGLNKMKELIEEDNDINFTIISFVNYKIQNNTLFPLHLCRYMVKFFKYVTEV